MTLTLAFGLCASYLCLVSTTTTAYLGSASTKDVNHVDLTNCVKLHGKDNVILNESERGLIRQALRVFLHFFLAQNVEHSIVIGYGKRVAYAGMIF